MDRRDFLKTAAVTGISALFFHRLQGAEPNPDNTPDLVAVRNGEPAQLLDAGLAALGGIKRFVKPGQTVVIKPNIGWDRTPEEAAEALRSMIEPGDAILFKGSRSAGMERSMYELFPALKPEK